ncbi:MAG: hypothetical protein V7604_4878 [Hyphomicrobiales bacterium]|jgi:hypothetical protein
MADIDPTADYHRRLDGHISKLPYAYYEARTEAFRKAGARTAYTVRDKGLVPIMYLEKKDQDFKKYATGWEILHSRIPFGDGSGNVDPVVDENMTVVGHFGVFSGDQIYVPPGIPSTRRDRYINFANTAGAGQSINELSRRNIDVVAHRYPASASPYVRQGYVEYGLGVSRYAVLTDIEGHVLMQVSSWSVDGIDPSSFSPLDLIAIGKLVVLGLSALAAGLVVRTLARRFAAKALSSAVKRELGSGARTLGHEVDEELLKKYIVGDPATVRLGRMGEPGNLFARVEVAEGKVIYRVGAIVLKGEGEVAEIALARAAHREMIRRAAQKAQQSGLSKFELRGIDANANFRAHADDLAREIGVPGSGKALAGSAPGFTSYEVTLDVAKALAKNAKAAAAVTK